MIIQEPCSPEESGQNDKGSFRTCEGVSQGPLDGAVLQSAMSLMVRNIKVWNYQLCRFNGGRTGKIYQMYCVC